MTIQSSTSRVAYTGDGVSTVFTVPFMFFANTDLAITQTDLSGTVTPITNAVIAGAGNPSGGTVTLLAPLTSLYKLNIYLAPSIRQLSHYISNAAFPADTLEDDLDRSTQIGLYLQEQIANAIRVDVGEVAPNMKLPSVPNRKSTMLGFDANGDAAVFTSVPSGTLSQDSVGTVLYPLIGGETSGTVVHIGIKHRDIRRYGGVDDDATDNTAAINNAILVGGQIEFPTTNTGVYRTAGGHTLPDGVSLKGMGYRTGSPYFGSGLKLTANATMFTCVGRNVVADLEFSTTTTVSPFVNAGTAIQIGSLTAFAGFCKILRCRGFNFHCGIQNSGGLFLTVQDCDFSFNNYGTFWYNTGATTSNSTVWINNRLFSNQRGGIAGSMASRGVGHQFIGGSIEGNGTEAVGAYPQVSGLVIEQVRFQGVYMEFAVGAVPGPNFIDVSGMSDGSIEDCYFNLSIATSGTGIISSGAGCSRLFIRGNRFLGANFTNDINTPACTGIRAIDNDHSVAASIVTGTGSQLITGVRLTPTIIRETGFTPVIQGTSVAGTQNYAGGVQQGYSTQIDNLVHFRLRITLTGKDGTTAGNLQIGGLPVAASANANGFATFALAVENLTQSASRTQFVGRLSASGTAIDLMESGSNVTLLPTVAANLQNTTSLYCTGTYAAANPT